MLRIITSNRAKFEEFRRILGDLGVEAEVAEGVDLPEVDGDKDEVIVHKAVAAGPGAVVEDTVLEIDGREVVDIRWRIGDLARHEGRPVRFVVSLGVNDGETVSVYRGVVTGVVRSPRVAPPAEEKPFGFDPFVVPDGAGGLSLHELRMRGRKDEFSARALALRALRDGERSVFVFCGEATDLLRIDEIPEWGGGWQGGPKP